MANVRISQLPANPTAITGAELVPITQNGQTVHTTVSQIANSPTQTQTFLTVGAQSTLPNSRYIGGGLGIGSSDGGAQGLYSLYLNGTSGSLENASTGVIVKSGVNTVVSRSIAAGTAGLSVANGTGVAGNPTLSLTGLALSAATLSGSGIVSLVSGSYFQQVQLTGTTNQINIANPNGGSNPTFSIADNPVFTGTQGMNVPAGTTAQRASNPTNGQMRYNTSTSRFEFYEAGSWATIGTGDGTVTQVNNVVNQTSVTNATTTPTVGLANNPVIPGVSAMTLPRGGTSDRTGTPVNGMIRYNTDTALFEGYLNGAWTAFAAGSGVTSVATGTGLTGGPITSTGTISIANTTVTSGTYGDAADVATFVVNAQGQLTAASNVAISIPSSAINTAIPNSKLANSSVTYNGVAVALGGAGTITATATNALTIGTGLSGTSYNGSSPVTIAIDSTVATLTGIQTLTNKSMSGSSNTFTNIPNSALVNNSLTIGSTNIALGGTALVLTDLTSISVTQDPVDSNQLATKAYVDNRSAASLDIHPSVVGDVDSNLSATYAQGGTTPTWTTITGGNTIATGSAHGLSVNDVIVFGSTTNGITSGTAYFVESVVSSTSITLSLTYDGVPIALTNGTGLSITSRANSGVGSTLTSTTNGPLTYEGYTFALTDRVLIIGQSTAYQNGVYTVTQAGVASVSPWILTRATDGNKYIPNSASGLDAGSYFLVTGGGDQGEAYVLTTAGTLIIGTTALTFNQFSQVTPYTAGTGLTLSSFQFSITNTGVTAASYGLAASVPTIAVNSQGQITSASNTAIAINGNQITSGTVGSAYISGSYTGITGVGTLTAGTWTASTIGVGYGGTGFASYAVGDMLYASGTTALSKLTLGTSGYVLTAGASAPQYVAQSTLSVGSATNASNVAVTTGAATTNYIHFGTATTGNLPVLTNTNFTYNSSTNAITGGITGGTF